MTDESKNSPKTDLVTAKVPQLETPPHRNSAAKTGLWIVLVLQVFIIIGLIAAGFYYYTKMQDSINTSQNSVETSLNKNSIEAQSLKKEINQIQDKLNTLSGNTLSELQTDLHTALQQFETFQQNLTAINTRLTELSPRDEQQWLISQIEYFIQMAQYRLTLTGDHQGAALLIDQALAVAAQLRSPDAQKLISTLSQDRANLKIEGFWQPEVIHAQLNALIEKIPALSIAAYTYEDFDNAGTPTSLSSEGIGKIISSLVRVQKTDQSVKPLLNETTRKQVEQHMFMLLTEAQLNLMRQNQSGYESSLNQLEKLTQEAFVAHQKETQFFLEEIKNLKNTQISRPSNTLGASQQALRNLISIFEKKDQ